MTFTIDFSTGEILILTLSFFTFFLILLLIALLRKFKRSKTYDLENIERKRVKEVSSIDVRIHTEISRGHPRSKNESVPTFVHLPSPTFDPKHAFENPAFSDDEELFSCIFKA